MENKTTKSANKLLFIGGGKICEAIVNGIIMSGFINKEDIVVCEPDDNRRNYMKETLGVCTASDSKKDLSLSNVVVLAVKPNIVGIVLKDIGSSITENQLVISVAAGVPIKFMESFLSDSCKVVRVMPNTPCLVSEAAAGVSLGSKATKDDEEFVTKMLSAVGKCFVVDEKLLDAVTGLSGSGPAYVFMIIQALSDGGVKMGLPRNVATTLAAQTVFGSAKMVLESGKHPGELKDGVITPGGTTIDGVYALEQGGLNASLISAVEAAANKSKELGKLFVTNIDN